MTGRYRRLFALAALLSLSSGAASAGPVVGFLEDWPGTSIQGWGGGPSHMTFSNPGSGGVGGALDGYLVATNANPPNLFATRSQGAVAYTGDWSASGVNSVKVWLNDVGNFDGFEVHFGIGNTSNFWQYNTGFLPASNEWLPFQVDLTDSTKFTHIITTDGLGYAWALQHANTVLLRHDFAPFGQFPDAMSGDLGIDRVELLGGTSVGVDGPGAARVLTLHAPSPNPSSGPVEFALETADASPVTIEVVDLQGRMVRRATLPGGMAGARLWTWDGRDSGGRPVAAGSYRVRATSAAGAVTRSLVRLGN